MTFKFEPFGVLAPLVGANQCALLGLLWDFDLLMALGGCAQWLVVGCGASWARRLSSQYKQFI